MEDEKIISLYWERSEDALQESEAKYGAYCHTIAYNILKSHSDADECVNDAFYKAWNLIPPVQPRRLSSFLGKLVRNTALDRLAASLALKRRGETLVLLEELAETLPSGISETLTDEIALKDAINRFLRSLPPEKRNPFLQRYWYFRRVKDIAREFGMSENTLAVQLKRLRAEMKLFLEQEGITV